jgi:hypothetical protein
VDEIGKRLRARRSLVKISALSTKCVGGYYALRFELVVTHGTTKLYLTQRCHIHSSCLPDGFRKKREGIFVPEIPGPTRRRSVL